MSKIIKYQQGDVVFITGNRQLKEVDSNLEYQASWGGNTKSKGRSNHSSNDDSSCVVAFGEVTGHKHQFNMNDQLPNSIVKTFGSQRQNGFDIPEFVKITGSPATITHEEHNPLTIPEGTYTVNIVNEWDHISGIRRTVAD